MMDGLSQQSFYLLVNILAGIAKLLVKHLVGSRETEALKTPYTTVGTNESFEGDGQASGHAKLLLTSGQNALLILLALAAEQTL